MDELLVLLAFAVTGAVAYVRSRRRDRRARALAALAPQLGLSFSAFDLFDDEWQPFRLFGLGTERHVENVLYGTLGGVDLHGFDYRFRVDEEGSLALGWSSSPPLRVSDERAFSCVVAGVDASCPPLTVSPRGIEDALTELVGGDVLPLELEGFNRRFAVRCEDRRFAVAFLEQRMMAALLTLPMPATLSVSEDRLLLVSRRLPPDDVAVLLHAASAIRRAVPRVLPSLYPLRPGLSGSLATAAPDEVVRRFDRLLSRRRDRAGA